MYVCALDHNGNVQLQQSRGVTAPIPRECLERAATTVASAQRLTPAMNAFLKSQLLKQLQPDQFCASPTT